MSNSILYFFLIILCISISLIFLPWWMTIVVTAVLAFIFQLKKGKLIGWAMIGGFLSWLGFALYYSYPNDFLLAEKIGVLLGEIPVSLILVITALCGAISGGLGSWLGSSLRGLMK